MATSTDQNFVDYGEYIDYQLHKTQSQIKATDFFMASIGVLTFLVVYLLIFTLLDHWVIPGGFSNGMRPALLTLVILISGAWVFFKVILPFRKKIHSLYTAKTIENASPELKNSLLNLINIEESQKTVRASIYRSMEKQAAVSLSEVDVSHAVDRKKLINYSYLLLFAVVCFCLYAVLSPKQISLWRPFAPFASVDVSTVTEILSVDPGDTEVLAQSELTVTVDLRGKVPEKVYLYYTTEDKQFVNEQVELKLEDEGLKQFQTILNGENGRGILQNMTYRIEAGDAISKTYQVTVNRPPTVSVREIQLSYPNYMRLSNRTLQEGNIEAWEGTQVLLTAEADTQVRSAVIYFEDEAGSQKRAEEVSMQIKNGNILQAQWELSIRDDGTSPKFYYIECQSAKNGQVNKPTRYTLNILKDKPPVIYLKYPTSDLTLPSNAVVPLLVEAADTDFQLRSLYLHIEKNGEMLPAGIPLFDSELKKSVRVPYDWELEHLGLKPEDDLTYWVEARDNRQPVANKTNTSRMNIRIVEPKPEKEIQEQLEEQKQEQQKMLEEEQKEQQEKEAEQQEEAAQKENNQENPAENQPANQEEEQKNDEAQAEKEKPRDPENNRESDQDGEKGKSSNQAKEGNNSDENSKEGAQDDAAREGNQEKDSSQKADDEEALKKMIEKYQNQESNEGENSNESDPKQNQNGNQQNQNENPDKNSQQQQNNPQKEKQENSRQNEGQNNKNDEQKNEASQDQAGNSDDKNSDSNKDSSNRNTDQQNQTQNENSKENSNLSENEKANDQKEVPDNNSQDQSKNSNQEKYPDSNNKSSDDNQSNSSDSNEEKPEGNQNSDNPSASGNEKSEKQDAGNPDQKSSDPNGNEKANKDKSEQSSSSNGDKDQQSQKGTGKEQGEASAGNPDEKSTKVENKVDKKEGEKTAISDEKSEEKQSDNLSNENKSEQKESQSGNSEQNQKKSGSEKQSGSDKKQSEQNSQKDSPQSNSEKEAGKSEQKGSGKKGTEEGKEQKPSEKNQNSQKQDSGSGDQQSEQKENDSTKRRETDENSEKKEGQQDGSGSSNQKKDSNTEQGGKSGKKNDKPGTGGSDKGTSKEGKPDDQARRGNGPGKGGAGSKEQLFDQKKQGEANETDNGDGKKNKPGDSDGGDSANPDESEDEANADFTRKAADLVLKKIEDDLKRGKVDKKLLEELGWNEKDMAEFAERLKKQMESRDLDQSPESQARQQQFEEMLKNMSIQKGGKTRKETSDRTIRIKGFGNRKIPVPPQYREAYEAYSREVSKKKK